VRNTCVCEVLLGTCTFMFAFVELEVLIVHLCELHHLQTVADSLRLRSVILCGSFRFSWLNALFLTGSCDVGLTARASAARLKNSDASDSVDQN
jgi:hypothetical protein